jgi:hypothetical protein
VLQGSVVGQDDVLRLQARVTDAESREIIWAVSDALERDARQLWAVADERVDAIVGELGDYAGVLLPRSADDTDASLAGMEAAGSLAFCRYISDGTNASLLQAREALGRSTWEFLHCVLRSGLSGVSTCCPWWRSSGSSPTPSFGRPPRRSPLLPRRCSGCPGRGR